ncbi:MAG: hypothetical protein ACRBFS_08755 [Aureispira sp.]
MKEDYFSQEERTAPWKSALSVVLIVILGLFLLRALAALIVPIIVLILLFANRDLVLRLGNKIMALYNEELYKGLLATFGAFILFTPFVVFLFFRTIYNIFGNASNVSSSVGEEQGTRIKYDSEVESLESRVERLLREDKKDRY